MTDLYFAIFNALRLTDIYQLSLQGSVRNFDVLTDGIDALSVMHALIKTF